MENNRNFFITIALSVLILVVWQVFYMNPRIEAQREATKVEQARQEQTQAPAAGTPATGESHNIPGAAAPSGAGTVQPAETRQQALAGSTRVKIDTPSLSGSINLTGARLDDLVLKQYHETVDKSSPNIHLLSPTGLDDAYYVELGYTGDAAAGDLPGPGTVWSVDGNSTLTQSNPVTLTYTNHSGLTFARTIAVDANYMFTVTDKVTNGGGQPVSLSSYGRTTRYGTPHTQGTYVLHEGLIGVTGDEGLQEIKYKTLQDDKQIVPSKSKDGWLGITDKYWAVALIPPTAQAFQPRFSYFSDGKERYQADYLTDAVSVAPGQSTELQSRFFAGAKQVSVVDGYKDEYKINRFDRLIDWGWFYFLTKPMFYLMDWLYHLLGNFGLAILGTTVIVKLIFFPLANKSYKSMANMKKVQPAMLEIREKYADDKMKQQQAMMELYKKEKINPIAGCWPVALQIPVFFSLYKVLYITIEMRHAPFFGWIQDLAAPDPTSIFNLFGLLPWTVPHIMMIGVWPLIMGVTMFIQMRMNPTPPDPTQAMIFTWMPIVFTFMLASFPAGLVIYWAWNNTLSVIQQGVIMKRQGVKIELWDNLAGLFRRKPKPAE
jgi:YidC/Oxa1 family membrane protein insertase